jgi:DNA-binding NarL/FixJ family response regulator
MILVVDDDPAIILSLSDYLQTCNYSVIHAENGQNALNLVRQYRPHLLITDILMPEMDGYQLVKKIRQEPFFRLLPVIFLSSRTTTQDRILGYQMGCDVYLPKPFDLLELGAVVRNLLERSQLIQSEIEFSTHLVTQQIEDRISSEGEKTLTSSALKNSSINVTEREQEVLDLLTWGLSNVKIGKKLHLSPRTVEKYVTNLLRKTSTANRAELVRFAIEHQLVE